MIDAGTVMAYLDLDSKKYTSGIKSAIAAAKDLGNNSLSASSKLKGLGSALTQTGQNALGLTTALVGVGTAAVTSFTKFDDSIRQVWATMNATADEQQRLVDIAKDAASGPNATKNIYDVAAGLDALAAAGYDVEQSQTALSTVMLVAQAGNLGMARSTDILAGSMNALDLEMGKLPEFADQISSAAQNSNASIAEMGDALLAVGGYAKQLKGGTVELTTGLGVLADAMIKGSEGGTSLRNIIRALASPEDGAAKVLKDLKVSAYDATTGAFRPLNETLGDLDAALSKLNPEKRAQQMSKIFNAFDLNAAEVLMSSTSGRWAELSAEIEDSAGSMQKMADTLEGGLGGAVRSFLANLSVASAEVGEEFEPTVRMGTEALTEFVQWFRALPPEMRSTIVNVGALVAALGPALIIGGKLISTFGMLAPLFTGPGGWVTLGIAGVAALAMGLNSLYAETSAIDDALAKVDPDRLTAYQTAKAKATVDLDVDVDSDGEANVTTAVSKLRAVLMSIDVLSDEEREAILRMIGDDLNPIKSALSAAGLDAGQAEAVQGEIDVMLATLREKLAGMNIVDETTLGKIMTLVSYDKAQIRGALLGMGLSDVQADSVAAEIIAVQDTIRARLTSLNILSETELRQIMKMVGEDKAQLIGSLKAMGLTEAEAQAVADAINASTNTIASGVYSLYDKIYQALTDGKPDTADQTALLKSEAQTYYDELIAGINLETEKQLANLTSQLENGFITAEEYQTRADAITQKNGALIAGVQKTCTDTLRFVSRMSGQSTTEVQAALGKIEALKQDALAIAAEIAKLTEEAESAESKRAQNLVKAGVKVDDATMAQAFGAAESTYKLGNYGAEQTAKSKRDVVDQDFDNAYSAAQSEGASEAKLQTLKDNHDKQVAEIEADLAADKERVQAEFTQTINELMAGLASQDPQTQAALQTAMDSLNLGEKLAAALQQALETHDASGLTSQPLLMEAIKKALEGDGITTDPTAYVEGMVEGGSLSRMAWPIRSYVDGVLAEGKRIIEETGALEESPMAVAMRDLIESGLTGALDGFDPASEQSKLQMVLGQMDIPKTVADGITDSDGKVTTAAQGLADDAIKPLDGMATDAKTSGADSITGLINGAESKRDSLVSKFKSLAKAAIQAAKDELGIASPSKVFAAIGANTVTSMADSINKNRYIAEDSMRRLTSLSALSPSTITGAGTTYQSTNNVTTNHYGAPISVTFPGAVVRSDADILELERRTQKVARDLQYGLGARP